MTTLDTFQIGDTCIYMRRFDPTLQGIVRQQAEKGAIGQIVAEVFGSDAILGHTDSGRPFIKGFEGDVSISHCQGYAALAAVPSGRVGIDIEHGREQLRRVASRFLSEAELKLYGDSTESLLSAWTRKEAIFKCLDTPGLTIGGINLCKITGIEIESIKIDAGTTLSVARLHF